MTKFHYGNYNFYLACQIDKNVQLKTPLISKSIFKKKACLKLFDVITLQLQF